MATTGAKRTRYTEAEAAGRLSFVQAALGAAGHEVTDPVLKELLARQARGEISGDEARELGRRHILGQREIGESTTTATGTATTQAERRRLVDEAIHSGEMEGLAVSAAGQADAGEYVAGRIDSDELVARARARYGLG